jgi:hypothetical protein
MFWPNFIEDFAFGRPPACLQKSPKTSGNLTVIREWWAQWWAHCVTPQRMRAARRDETLTTVALD